MKDKTWIGVALGGFAGAVTRYGFSQSMVMWGTVPLNIVMINLLGAFLLAFFLELSLERLKVSPLIRAGISTGFLGAFTTFSGLCSEAFGLAGGYGAGMAGFYLFSSAVGGMIAAFSGVLAARMLMRYAGEHRE